MAAGDRHVSVRKVITAPALEDGGKKVPAKYPGKGLLEDEPRSAVPKIEEKFRPAPLKIKGAAKTGKQKAAEPVSKIRDVAKYDPSKVSDEVLRDDFRIVLAWYTAWKKDPKGFKHDRATIERLLRGILKEAIRRGPKTIRFNPKGMTAAAREFFDDIAAQVKVPKPMFKRVRLATDTDPGDLTTAELLEVHERLHRMYRAEAFSPQGMKGWSTEDIVNLHARVVDELEEREKAHPSPPPDGLDDTSEEFEVEKRYAKIRSSGVIEGKEIKLDDVLSHFETFKIRKPYIYLVGGLANRGKTKGDIDILVKDSDKLPEAFKHVLHFRLGRALPEEISDRLSIHYDKYHGPFCLTGDRVVVVKQEETLRFLPIAELWEACAELGTPRGDQTVEAIEAPRDTFTLGWEEGRAVWTRLECVTRNFYEGDVVLLRQRWGQTEVTPNHSVYESDGSLVTPEGLQEMLALRELPEIETRSKVRLPKTPEQSGRWALEGGLNRDYEGEELRHLLRLISAYVSDGWAAQDGRMTIADGDFERLKEVGLAVERLWGFSPYIRDRREAEDHTSQLIINRRSIGTVLSSMCNSGSPVKKFPSWVFNLSASLRAFFLEELIKGDGNVRQRRQAVRSRYFTCSPVLLSQVCALFASLGKDFAVERNAWSPWTRTQGFCVAERGGSDGRSRIRRERRRAQEYVYNLSCERVHNFVDGCGLVVVHNTNHVPLYDLTLEAVPEREVVEMRAEAESDD